MISCTCTYIAHSYREDCEIEFCPVHIVAIDMYDELKAIKLILGAGFPLENADLDRIVRLVDKAEGK